jgi:hypothetical protein
MLADWPLVGEENQFFRTDVYAQQFSNIENQTRRISCKELKAMKRNSAEGTVINTKIRISAEGLKSMPRESLFRTEF